jgi:nicotinamidase-related amidase/type 1 glutamine amidotransferase
MGMLVSALFLSAIAQAESLDLFARYRVETEADSGEYDIEYKTLAWDPKKTAIIICDMWDTMKCKIPADRVAEMAPRINEVAKAARARGVLIVHAPSGTMDHYAGTPQRQRCLDAPKVETAVPLRWNYLNPEREAPLPIDDSDGGWEGPLADGPPPQSRQHPAIEIGEPDAIGDGADIYYLLEQRGIDNVIVMGVHTNMCVLGRPFSIRQMTYLGKNVALMRDCTDSLYNPEMPPHVSHVRGTELVLEHVEKYWCPTVTSASFLNKPTFRFEVDTRPHVAFIVSDDHYGADETLPQFAQVLRERYGVHCTVLHGQHEHDIPQMVELEQADAVVVYVRRLGLPVEQLQALQNYVKRGGGLVALRTASHGFTMKYNAPADFKPPEGRAEWREFDAAILGGNYHNHAPNELGTDVRTLADAAGHPVLRGIDPAPWHSTGSLYFTKPVAEDATVLMRGSVPDEDEPLTWVREGLPGRVLYSALGHPDDFEVPQFERLLVNAVFWAMDKDVPEGK